MKQPVADALKAGTFTIINLSPIDVGYGLLLASVLGLPYATHGISAAFLSVLAGNLVPALLGRSGMLFSGARPAQTLLVAELVVHLLQSGQVEASFSAVFPYLAMCTLVAGLLEMAFGFLRVGSIIKYFPVPVMTGYINAVALLIVWPATVLILGFPRGTPLFDLILAASASTLGQAAFGLLLLVLMAWVHRDYKRLHWSVAGLFGGIALFYLIQAVTGISLGRHLPEVGNLAPPWGPVQAFATGDLSVSLVSLVKAVLPYALAIAVLNSMESLLASAKFEELSGRRSDANQVLMDQGLANAAGALLGALPVAPSISRINIGWELGGRGPMALAFGAMACVVLMVLGSHVIGMVPVPVVGCLMVFLAWTMLDNWTHGQVRKIFSASIEPTLRRQVRTNMMIMLAVVAVAFTGHLIAAMVAGIVLAMAIFVRDYGRSVIGRSFSGRVRHSVVKRQEHEADYLNTHGDAVLIQELNAPIVFGTADRLLDHCQHLPAGIRFLVFDCHRVREIDDKGARILVRLAKSLGSRGIEFHLSHILPAGPRGSILMDAGLGKILPPERWHADTDRALETIENRLLAEAKFPASRDMDLRDLDIAAGLDDNEIEVLMEHLRADSYTPGNKIFSRGESGDRLYIVAIGNVEIFLPLEGDGQSHRRLAAFPPGVVFGEMALFTGADRSADAIASCDTAVWSLSRSALERLRERRPMLVSKLMMNIAHQLSSRLAVTNDELIYATRN